MRLSTKPNVDRKKVNDISQLSDSVSFRQIICETTLSVGQSKPPWHNPSKYNGIIEQIRTDITKEICRESKILLDVYIFDDCQFAAVATEDQQCEAFIFCFPPSPRIFGKKIIVFRTPNGDLGTVTSTVMTFHDRDKLHISGSKMMEVAPASVLAYLRITGGITPEMNMESMVVFKHEIVNKVKYQWLFPGIADGKITLLHHQQAVIAWKMSHFTVKTEYNKQHKRINTMIRTLDNVENHDLIEHFKQECSVTPILGHKRNRKDKEEDNNDINLIPTKKSKQ